MKRTYICTKEEPLHKQISPKESLLIEELEVKGYLDGDDYELLTELAIFPYSFVNSVRLEEIVFPNNLKGIGYESFINCENLVIDELPFQTLLKLALVLEGSSPNESLPEA